MPSSPAEASVPAVRAERYAVDVAELRDAAVTLEATERAAGGRVPQPHGLVGAARSQHPAVGSERERRCAACAVDEHRAGRGGRVPRAYRPAAVAGDQRSPSGLNIMAETTLMCPTSVGAGRPVAGFHSRMDLSMPAVASRRPSGLQRHPVTVDDVELVAGRIPESHGAVGAAAGQETPVRAERDLIHQVRVTPEDLAFGAVRRVPEPDGPVPACRGQQVGVGAESDPGDGTGMTADGAQVRTRARFPQEGAPGVGACDEPHVGAERHGPEALASLERAHQAGRWRETAVRRVGRGRRARRGGLSERTLQRGQQTGEVGAEAVVVQPQGLPARQGGQRGRQVVAARSGRPADEHRGDRDVAVPARP